MKSTKIKRREYDIGKNKSNEAVQRIENSKRVSNISMYYKDPYATFPTPIVIAVNSNSVKFEKDYISFDEKAEIGEIIDGQHRLLGIKNSNITHITHITLPIVIMFDLLPEEKAYMFSTINSNQVTVPKSLIDDLYDISKYRSTFKISHEIARAFNSDKNSPYYNRLKMLGKKQTEDAALSQGAFVTYLLKLISKNAQEDEINIKNNNKLEVLPDKQYPFRQYFIDGKDDVIYKIMFNAISALSNVFSSECQNSNDYILSKSTGYGALIKSMPQLIKNGKKYNDLSYDYFFSVFKKLEIHLINDGIQLTSKYFPSNEQTQGELSKLILKEDKCEQSI